MALKHRLEDLGQRLADLYFMLLPRRAPSRRALQQCRLVAHRGEHDGRRVLENTLAAFRAAAAAGVWGIEMDLRWTRDLEPVVIHDSTTGRVFGADLAVAEVGAAELRERLPEIPRLAEVVAEFGGVTHLMVELKSDSLGEAERKNARLGEIFAGLEPGRDFHMLALAPELFAAAAFAGPGGCLLVAELDVDAFSREVAERGYAGLCGHYLLLGRRLLARHHALGQGIGTGFASSRYCFYRELERGVDWIFSNHACKMAAIREDLLRRR